MVPPGLSSKPPSLVRSLVEALIGVTCLTALVILGSFAFAVLGVIKERIRSSVEGRESESEDDILQRLFREGIC